MSTRKQLYRYRLSKQLGKYQFMFDYIPGRWFSSGTDNLVEAVHWADDKVEADLGGRAVTKSDITLNDFARDFFLPKDPHGIRRRDIKHGHNYEEVYYEHKQRFLEKYILPRFGNQTLLSLTSFVIEDWFLELKSIRKDRDLADDTKNKCLITFRDVLKEAVRKGLIPSNPAESVDMITVRSAKRQPFTKEELGKMFPEDDEELLKIWGNLFWATYFLIARDTGFRPGEIAALRVDSYFPDLHGFFSKTSVDLDRKLKNSIKTAGKGKDYKVGLLTNQTERFLNKRILACQAKCEEFLFLLDGRFLNAFTSNKHFVSFAGRVIDMQSRTQYCMRHSFETDLAGKVENKVVAELMAHTSFNPTYDHRTPEMLLKELQPVRELLEKRSPDRTG